ncbi:thioesterase mmyt [Mycobacterium gallinarum]|uniref:Thioesterase TesA n=1 Tax=Mycobacterium gallinarum TaxID=39689 RepID=A0A9W4FI97_9MYCO|nr:alpha/beta fold hydrolase [Mycobacterium gallinarum]BBY95558.1 thioesterase mmyt [Mycobacterium gallinarum]
MLVKTLTEEPARPISRLSGATSSRKATRRVRLICFHHAGGGASSFNLWKRGLSADVDVVAVDVPDRERFATLSELVEAIHDRLGPLLDEPHVFFGHSFGALVAYRLASLRAAAGLPLPSALIVSSFPPPHLPTAIHMVHDVDDQQLSKVLSDIGGLPVELDRWPCLRKKAVALARIDLRLGATDDDATSVPLTCPIHAFGGSDDFLVSERELRQWSSRTVAEFSVQMLKGNHFHISDRKQLFAALEPLLFGFDAPHANVA